MANKSRAVARTRRHARVRKNLAGTAQRPRLNVFRSLTGIYAQVIDDQAGRTLASASTAEKDLREKVKGMKKSEQAKLVGQTVAERAKSKGVEKVVDFVGRAAKEGADLVAFPLTVDERFHHWLTAQEQAGVMFTDEQTVWLTRIKDHLATSLTIAPDDFELEPFTSHGGFGRANATFNGQLAPLLETLTTELAA